MERSFVVGPLWEEFKSLNYSNSLIESHEEVMRELESYYEICKEHIEVSFVLPRIQISEAMRRSLESVDFLPDTLGLEIVGKEISHFQGLIQTLTSILMLPKAKAQHHIQTIFGPKRESPTPKLVIQSKGYKSSLSPTKIEAFLLKRYESYN